MNQNSKNNGYQLKPSTRSKARQLVLQALYQWQITKASPVSIESQFRSDNNMSKVDDNYFNTILHGVIRQNIHINESLTPLLDRPLDQLDPIELSALRIGCYELVNHPEIPYRVIINEAIKLVKKFGAQDSHRYINGVMDKLSSRIRINEYAPIK